MPADIVIHERAPLAPRTTLEAGGAARRLTEARDEAQVRSALDWARDRGLPVHVLGGGSNLLVADRGLDGLVVRVRIEGFDVYTTEGGALLRAGAGEPWDRVVERAVERGLAGLECLSGIPGDAGSTPIQNVGAYGQEVADTLDHVEAIDRMTGETVTLTAAECAFAYRDSAFKGPLKGRYVLTRVAFRLRPGGAPTVRYAELSRALAGRAAPSLSEVRATVLALRRSKSMVMDPSDENHRSAGSFFTNPLVETATLERAREAATGVLRAGESMPEFPAGQGMTKLSAAWLIERSGFSKGFGEGRVGLSTRHTLAIVNRGGATAAEIVAFATLIKRGVFERFGVTLMPEPVLLGFDPGEIAELVGPAR